MCGIYTSIHGELLLALIVRVIILSIFVICIEYIKLLIYFKVLNQEHAFLTFFDFLQSVKII